MVPTKSSATTMAQSGSYIDNPKSPASKEDTTMLPFAGGFRFERMDHYDPSALMGRAYRNFITGVVQMKNLKDFPEFCLVDLWTRNRLVGDCNTYSEDRFLFRPVPLLYRTWTYHDLFRQRKVVQSSDDTAMIKYVLKQRVIDAPVGAAGSWSPIMLYSFSVVAATLTGNFPVVFYGISLIPIFCFIGLITNVPKFYYYQRLLALPFRIIWLVVLASAPNEEGSGVFTFGIMLAILLAVIDFVMGDGKMLVNYRLLCNYELFRQLPNRVFICKRHGAAYMEEQFGDRGRVDECITGMGSWDKTFMLLAEVHGILVELRPVKREEWDFAADEFLDTFSPKTFVGLDVFGTKHASANDIEDPIMQSEEDTLMNWPRMSYQDLGTLS